MDLIGEYEIDRGIYGKANNIMVSFDKDTNQIVVTLFDGEEVVGTEFVSFSEVDGKLQSNVDEWQNKCLDLAATLDRNTELFYVLEEKVGDALRDMKK